MAPDGTVVFDSSFRKNVIMDRFFADISTGGNSISACVTGVAGNTSGTASAVNMVAGSGTTTPLRVDSTPTNLSQSGTTVTAASGFFTSGMVGRLLVFGGSGLGNNPCYITAFTNSTTVTVSTSATVGSQVGSVYTVSGFTVSGTTAASASIPTNSGNQGTAYSGGVYSYTVTRQWTPQSGSPVTYLQLELQDSGGNVIAGFQIPGAGDTVGVGFFYLVTWVFQMTVSPSAPSAVGNIGTGINTAGNIMLESLYAFSTINSGTGNPAGGGLGASIDGHLTGTSVASAQLTSDSYSQNASVMASGSEPVLSDLNGYASTNFSYSNTAPANTGTAVNGATASYNTTGNNSSVTGLCFMTNVSKHVLLDVKLTTPYASPASGSFTFAFTFTFTFGRTVTN